MLFSDARSASLIRGAVPTATVGVDTTGDGRANYVVSGIDADRNGIPDVLQSPRSQVLAAASISPSASYHNLYGTALLDPVYRSVYGTTGLLSDVGSSRVLLDSAHYQRTEYMQSLELQVRTLSAQVNEKSSLLVQLQSQLKLMQAQVDRASIDTSEWNAAVLGKDSYIEDLKNSLATKVSTITGLEMKVAELTSALESRTQSLVFKEQAMTNELQIKMASLSAVSTRLSETEALLASRVTEIRSLEGSLSLTQARLGERESEVNALRIEMDRALQAKIESSVEETLRIKNALESQIAELRIRVSTMDSERQHQDARILELEADRVALNNKLSEADSKLLVQNNDARLINEETLRLKHFLNVKTSMVDELQQKLSTLYTTSYLHHVPTTVQRVLDVPTTVSSPRTLASVLDVPSTLSPPRPYSSVLESSTHYANALDRHYASALERALDRPLSPRPILSPRALNSSYLLNGGLRP